MKTPRFCIYAVDDDEDDRLLIKTVLDTYSDCEVSFFDDGESLLAALWASPTEKLPVLILLDLDMPRVDGYEVLHMLRVHSALRSIPVLVLSGTRSEKSVLAAYNLGANSFMSKPSSFTEMTQLLKVTYDYWLKTAHTPGNP